MKLARLEYSLVLGLYYSIPPPTHFTVFLVPVPEPEPQAIMACQRPPRVGDFQTAQEGQGPTQSPQEIRLIKQEKWNTIKKEKRSMVTQKQETESEPEVWSSPHNIC